MISEVRQELMEIGIINAKVQSAEIMCRLLQNALCYMTDNGETRETCAEYLCCSPEMIDAIDKEDYEMIRREDDDYLF